MSFEGHLTRDVDVDVRIEQQLVMHDSLPASA